MQRYLLTMCYEHENYVNDIERKKQYKNDIVSVIHKQKHRCTRGTNEIK